MNTALCRRATALCPKPHSLSSVPCNPVSGGDEVTPAHWRRRASAARGGPQLSVCAGHGPPLRAAFRLLPLPPPGPAMVLESVVADLLNRFLGDYVENLNKSQLKLGIWGGKRDATAYRHGRGGCACVSLGTLGTPPGIPLLATQPHRGNTLLSCPL